MAESTTEQSANQKSADQKSADQNRLRAPILEVFRARGWEGATLTELATAVGLSKASLYHHFPGGKAQMLDMLISDAVAEINQFAFAHVNGNTSVLKPNERLVRFIQGFSEYVAQGDSPCLLAIIAQGSAEQTYGARFNQLFNDWRLMLAGVMEDAGLKPKAARRSADALLAELYGGVLLARLTGDASVYRRLAKRLQKTWVE